MPLFEYRCETCGHGFEALVFGAERPACPRCQGQELHKLLSSFAVSGGGGNGSGSLGDFGPGTDQGSCGTCGDPRGPGACALD